MSDLPRRLVTPAREVVLYPRDPPIAAAPNPTVFRPIHGYEPVMRNEIYEGAASAASGGKDEARLDFLNRFQQDAPDERLDAAAKAQLQLLFKHTAGFAIDTGLVDWLATDRVTLKKKKFYLNCAGQVGKVALRNAGAGKIGKTHLIKASDEIVEKHMDTCKERFIFCLDYDNMPR